MDLSKFFRAKTVAIVGVSKDPNKIGHVILKNMVDAEYPGKIFVINPNADEIMSHKSYPSVLAVKEKIELAIIAVPASVSIKAVEECGKKEIKNVVIVTAGFKEVGNFKLDKKLQQTLKKYNIKCIGPNCLGLFDSYSHMDSLFLPRSRMKRPRQGSISFITQSGAVGSTLFDLIAEQGYGFAKFISYGNAMNIDESDILEFLGDDPETKVICLYVEGIHNGKKFMETAKKVSRKKPIVAIKGGLSEKGSKATLSHTGSLAGDAKIYLTAFRQSGIIVASSLEDMFNFARLLDEVVGPKGDKIQVITNGGGFGILAADSISKENLTFASLSDKSVKFLKRHFPPIAVIDNPMDVLGDADTKRYELALATCLADDNVDVILLILLTQTPLVSEDIVDVLIEYNSMRKKPIIVVSAGGEFTEKIKKTLEQHNVPCYTYPHNAISSIKQLVSYYNS